MKSRLTASIGRHPVRWAWLLGVLFCTAIGAILSLAMAGALVGEYFTVSYCIGLSVLACTEFGLACGPSRLPGAAVRFVMAVCGLAIGLAAGGVLMAGNPLLLLGDPVRVVIGALVCAIAGIGFEALKQVWNARAGLDQAERDRLTRDKTLAEAELRVLRAQVEPHFLFNSLANASALIRRHPERAARLLERLTSLLRVSLSRTRRAAGTLGDELAVVRANHAVEAFEYAAVDYLLKPVLWPRLKETVRRLKRWLVGGGRSLLDPQTLESLLRRLANAPAYLHWLRVGQGERIDIVAVDDVSFFRSERKYTAAVTADAEHLIRTPITELAAQLDPERFWRIHRGAIVNVGAIREARRDLRGRYRLALKSRPEVLRVSATYGHLFRRM